MSKDLSEVDLDKSYHKGFYEGIGKPFEERVISKVYFGYLVGRVKEQLEASISDNRQLSALKNVIADTMYDWWEKSITPDGSKLVDPGNPRANREIKNN